MFELGQGSLPRVICCLCQVLVTPRLSWLISFVFDLLMCEISQRPLTSRQTRLTGVKIYYLRRPPRPPESPGRPRCARALHALHSRLLQPSPRFAPRARARVAHARALLGVRALNVWLLES